MKKTISIRQFIAELGENFSEYIQNKLLELSSRCVLTRKETQNVVDLKHVEHIQHECATTLEEDSTSAKKEYSFGQFIVEEGVLYFSEKCAENNNVMQAPAVSGIYNALTTEEVTLEEDRKAKKVDDSNIDFIIDNIIKVCPPVSQAHLDIVQGMISRQENK
jgi:hypothetical protein